MKDWLTNIAAQTAAYILMPFILLFLVGCLISDWLVLQWRKVQ